MATGGNTFSRSLLLALALAIPASLALDSAVSAQESEATELLKKGMEQHRAGKFAEARATLEAAMAMEPSNQEVMAALSHADYSELMSMLAGGGDEEKLARFILDRAAPILPDWKYDEKKLAKIVRLAVESEDYGERFEAAMILARTYGEYAVPRLIEYLKGKDTDRKVNAHVVLMNRIGRDAVLPLNEALHSSNDSLRRFVAAELETIGDERSLAALAEAVETDENADTRSRADKALQALTTKFPDAAGMSASDLYLRLAQLYYEGTYRVKSFTDRPLVIWGWKGEVMKRLDVPRHLYMLKLAEEAAYDSLRLNAGNRAARALLARILLSESDAAQAVAAVSDDELSTTTAAQLAGVPGTVGALGWSTLAMALNDSLDSGDSTVAVGLLNIMPSIYGSADFTADNPVVRATGSSANAVRLAAADAVLRFNGLRRITAYPDPDAFLQLVATAVGEIIPRQILVIDGNDARRNKLLTELQGNKYVAFDARTGSDGYLRALRYAGLDMIVVNSDLPDMATLDVIGKLRDDRRTVNVPIVLVGTTAQIGDEDWKALYQDKVKAFTSVPEGPGLPTEAFLKIVGESFEGAGPDVQARYRVSSQILDALATTDTGNTLFNWAVLAPTLSAIVSGGDEVPSDPPVRHNAIRALGNMNDTSAVEGLAAFFGSTDDNSLKATAGHSIAQLCRKGTVTLSAGAFKALLGGTRMGGGEDGDAEIAVRDAAFAALGSAALSEDQSLRVV
ncbi:MAG: hypothetical protein O7E54_06095, partial [Planctomycetota bacterium]|nr:hypothetical protein [Planctomycetota bacterium]